MIQRRTMIAAMAGLLLAAAAPALAADAASPNDTARFLAGMPPAADSPLAALTKDGSWQQHARAFDSAFQRVDQEPARAHPRLVEQPTSPSRADRVLLLQRSGLPLRQRVLSQGQDLRDGRPRAGRHRARPRHDARVDRGASWPRLRGSLNTILSVSFFITKNMKSELRAGRVNGTLPILYVFLVRSGYTIREVTPVSVDAEGTLQTGDRRRPQRPGARHQDRVRRQRRRGADALLLQHQSRRRRRQEQRLPEVLRDARARRQLHQERVLPAAFGRLQQGPRLPARQQRRDDPGRFRHPARNTTTRRSGTCNRSAAISARSASSRAAISRNTPSSSRRANRSISASATGTGRASSICCSPSRRRRSRRLNRLGRRPGNRAQDASAQIDHCRRSGPAARGGSTGAWGRCPIGKRHGALPCGHAARCRISARGDGQGPGLATACQRLRRRVRGPGEEPARADSHLVGEPSRGAAADHALHVQRPRLPLRQRLLPQGQDLCAQRARAGRRGARPHHPARVGGGGARPRCADSLQLDPRSTATSSPSRMRSELRRRPRSTARCRSCTCSWRARATTIRAVTPRQARRATARCSRTPRPAASAAARGVKIVVRRQRRRGADALLLQHRSLQRGRQEQRAS